MVTDVPPTIPDNVNVEVAFHKAKGMEVAVVVILQFEPDPNISVEEELVIE